MEIQKVFSDYYDTERMYSVLMSEDELRLFALRDYAGLTKGAAKRLKFERNQIAKELRDARKSSFLSPDHARWLEANPTSRGRVSVSRYDKAGHFAGNATSVGKLEATKIRRENLLNMSGALANNAREVSMKKSGGFFGRLWDRIGSNTRPEARSRFVEAVYR